MKDFWKEPQEKKINKKKIIISISIMILILIVAIIVYIYIKDETVHNWIDKNILQKEAIQNELATIDLGENDNSNIYAFNKYIGILSKNNLKIYNNFGKEETTESIEITTPMFNSDGRYLAIAEENGKKVYVIEDKNIIWETEIEGSISQVCINKNGYLAVVITDTSYKTIIAMYDNQGKEMFKTYLSATRVSDVAISNDNKYLALSEIDTSGTVIQSNIKIVSIEKAKNNSEDSIEKTVTGENNDLIVNIKYNDKDRLICKYTDKITMMTLNADNQIITEDTNKKVSFSEINLSNNIVTVEEKSSGLFTADSVVTIINTENKKETTYTTNSVTKELYTCDNIIALNVGTEIEFINTSGWLVKKYIAEQEITKITVSNSIAGIIYRDKIEIINL